MDQHSIILRDARPTLAEGLAFAGYLDQAAEGFFRFLLGRDSEEILAKAYLQPNNDYSFENTIFAERDNVIVGMVSGFASDQRSQFAHRPLERAAGKRSFRTTAIGIILMPLFRILETIADGDFYLLAVATDKELRGQGIGSILINRFEDRGRERGSARLALDVSAKNEGARRLYGRRGMTVESEWPRLPLVPAVFVRMTKEL